MSYARGTTIRYFVPVHGGSQADFYEFETRRVFEDDDAQDMAEEAAEDFHGNHDGWECRWPLNISVILSDNSIRTFEVEREYEPYFSGREITLAEATQPRSETEHPAGESR